MMARIKRNEQQGVATETRQERFEREIRFLKTLSPADKRWVREKMRKSLFAKTRKPRTR